jgi:glycosyltransferase involved in cell wall biosynthesis
LPKLYQACNCFVLPSRGEGWGLNYTEAIAMKKPVIATRWSSQLDYLNDRNSYLVDLDTREPLKTCPACDWICVEYYGERFANPSLQSLRKQLRRVYGSRNEVGRRTEQAYQDIKKYTWQKSAKRMLERIIEIDKDLIKFETRI